MAGWLHGKDSCIAASDLWPELNMQDQIANASRVYAMYGGGSYYYPEYYNQFAGFCTRFEGKPMQRHGHTRARNTTRHLTVCFLKGP